MFNKRFSKIYHILLISISIVTGTATATSDTLGWDDDGKIYGIIGGHNESSEKCFDASQADLKGRRKWKIGVRQPPGDIKVKLTHCHHKKNQLWKLKIVSKNTLGDYLFTIHSARNEGKCLDASKKHLKKNKKHIRVKLTRCHQKNNQQWKIHKVNNFYTISSATKSEKCLDSSKIDLKNKRDDIRLKLSKCHRKNNQLWELRPKKDIKYIPNEMVKFQDEKNCEIALLNGKYHPSSSCNKNTSLTFNSFMLHEDDRSMSVGKNHPISFSIDHKFPRKCDADINACIVTGRLTYNSFSKPLEIKVSHDGYKIPLTKSKKNQSAFAGLRVGDSAILEIIVGKYKFIKPIVWVTNAYINYQEDVHDKDFYYFDTNTIIPSNIPSNADSEDTVTDNIEEKNDIKLIYHVLKISKSGEQTPDVSSKFYSSSKKIIADLIAVKDEGGPFNGGLAQYYTNQQSLSDKIKVLKLSEDQYISKISFCPTDYLENTTPQIIAAVIYTIKDGSNQEYTRVIGQYTNTTCPSNKRPTIEIQAKAGGRFTDIKLHKNNGRLTWISPILGDGSGEIQNDYNKFASFNTKLHETYRYDSNGKPITTGFYYYRCEGKRFQSKVMEGDPCQYPTFYSATTPSYGATTPSQTLQYDIARVDSDYGGFFYYKDGKLFEGYDYQLGLECNKGRCR